MAWLRRLSAVGLAALLLFVPAAQSQQDKPRLDRTVRYLQDVQRKDGGFGENGSNPTFSVWAALALASAGINPRDQKKPGGTDVYTYLTRNPGGLTQSTDFARLILVARAAGTSPRKFGSVDLVERLLALQRRDGGFSQPPSRPSSQINGTAYAVLALARIDRRSLGDDITSAQVRARIDRALKWLEGQQASNGSWDGTDLTGSVIEAFNAAGRRDTAAQAKALEFLRSRQNADGGFGTGEEGQSSNTASTAFVLRGLVAARINPSDFRGPQSGATPLQYLAGMQQPNGSVPYSKTSSSNTIWNTTYASVALSGTSLPIAEVVRNDQPTNELRDDDRPSPNRGDDGGQPGGGGTGAPGSSGDVTAGGGGGGAPLFSQPQPGSQGSAPGGARDTERPNTSPTPGQGGVDGESVVGRLVGQGATLATGKQRRLGTAPGLRAAAAGGQSPTWLVIAIGVALLLSALGGIALERRGPKEAKT